MPNRHCERLKGARQSILWIASSLLLLAMTVNMTAFAQDTAQGQPEDKGNLDKRIELATQMHRFRPVKEQVDKAIDSYVSTVPEADRERYRTAFQSILNYDALEKISVDAMVETYTQAELQAMVDFYSKSEARTASDKYEQYAGKVYPEIGKMMDRAIIRLKTGSAGP